MKTVGIIQVRNGSTRFPYKMQSKIFGRTLIDLYINRCKYAKLDDIVLATTTNEIDDCFKTVADNNGISFFRGSEQDVLDRYYQCARENKADIIVRLTPDDAFVDPDVIDKAVTICKRDKVDFVTNHFDVSYPEGLDIEVYPFPILSYIWYKSTKLYEREHVFPYIYFNKETFNIINFKQEENESNLRWTIDHEVDYEMVKEVYKCLYREGTIFKHKEIIQLIKDNPKIALINSNIQRKEGINKSIEAEKGQRI